VYSMSLYLKSAGVGKTTTEYTAKSAVQWLRLWRLTRESKR
jgi:hypothetical protein